MYSKTSLFKGLLSILAITALFWLVLTAFFSVITYRNQIYAELWAHKLVPESTPFTELYFENPSLLPSQILRNKAFSFAFTIHNLEGATTTYPYLVSIQNSAGQISTIAKGTVALANNALTTIPVAYSLKSAVQGNSEIIVDLTSLNQQIDFYVDTETQP